MSRTKSKKAQLYISYPLDKYAWGQLDAPLMALARKYGGEMTGGGTALGTPPGPRDLDFVFPTDLAAANFLITAKTRYDDLEHFLE